MRQNKKNLLLFFFVILIPLFSVGQTGDWTLPTQINTTWLQKFTSEMTWQSICQNVRLVRDTSAYGYTYHQLSNGTMFRQDGGKVYLRCNTPNNMRVPDMLFWGHQFYGACASEEILGIDFAAQEGDVIYHCPSDSTYKSTIGYVDIHESGRKMFELYRNSTYTTWLEGIGVIQTMMLSDSKLAQVLTPVSIIYYDTNVSCVSAVEERNLQTSPHLKLYNNPIQNRLLVFEVENAQTEQVIILNILGEIIFDKKTKETSIMCTLNEIAAGVYTLIVQTDKAKLVQRIAITD